MPNTRAQARGGVAAAAGGSYQDRVGAWFAVNVLAETNAAVLFELPSASTLETIRAQTGQAIDDFGCDVLDRDTGDRGYVFIQAKRRLAMSAVATSDIAKTIDECVRQYVAARPGRLDRYVVVTRLLTGPIADAQHVLERNRLSPAGDALVDAAATADEAEILTVLCDHARRAWLKATNSDPSDEELRALLQTFWIHDLDPEEGRPGERSALQLLRTSVVANPSQDRAVWSHLVRRAGQLARAGTGTARVRLQGSLLDLQIDLKVPRSNQLGVEALRRVTERSWAVLETHESIDIPGGSRVMPRSVGREIESSVINDSTIVTGEPGAGKSGAMISALRRLSARGADIVLLAAESVSAQDEAGLRTELGITASLIDTLRGWPGTGVGVLAVDGLDALRGSAAERRVRDILAEVVRGDDRWRVLVSVRSYDLRNSEIGAMKSARSGTELPRITVQPLRDQELDDLRTSAPELHRLATTSNSQLTEILRNPFNLALAARLLYVANVPLEELSPVRSQLALLDLYWDRRVIDTDGLGDHRERILAVGSRAMVTSRQLTVARSALAVVDPTALGDVLSRGVLVEWRALAGQEPARDTIAFAHHLLFDYAAALLFRGDDSAIVDAMTGDRALAVLLRPSAILHFHHLWESRGPDEFWRIALAFVDAAGVPELAKLTPGLVAAERATLLSHATGLLDAIGSSVEVERGRGALLFSHVVNTISASEDRLSRVAGPTAGPWLEMAAQIGPPPSPMVANSIAQLLRLVVSDA